MKKILVTASGVRLDKYLSENIQDISRSKIKHLIQHGKIMLGSKTINDPAYIVKAKDEFFLEIDCIKNYDLIPCCNISLDILYEDEYLSVINKPPGIVTHPGYGTKNDTLVNALVMHYNTHLSAQKTIRPGIVHRLDKETSGVIIIAKNDEIHMLLADLISNKECKRSYIGIIWGELEPKEGIITTNIKKHRNNKMMSIAHHSGKIAITKYKTLDVIFSKYGTSSILKFELETGRTHQIRVHCAYKKCPIIADKLYGDKTRNSLNLIQRQALHASMLKFIHPKKNIEISIKAPLPKDIEHLINELNG